ncbi:alpha-D-ribose 1-methylphosphonate 5-triphosphate synthase subunit PhnH [Aliiroseovarius halocynthiae]|uniref:Phosphonate C-P lyase system protein PhnH n=1 Tax=Aliiroseovarius halocynthiae TaxID=985055 RepID=A0A545SR54_9RHOB|nr:phosphonate C-P lyase system protein PhnH [Aliiroseovarius halocynthiae]TQV67376.1 phosphonate C-P lyase system protein PhnH [Aliiroseovarius halocynthiae]SMR81298.1 alpha-D-ribose 1-methylphosphonate 5-triphosphate synthase subunit PhnH [Aliiroseovarius halocynthiae]
MLSAPLPSVEETRANQSFDALLNALSRPGQIRTLPTAGEGSIVDALLDRECRVFCADPTLLPQVLETGAMIAELPDADLVFFGPVQDAEALLSVAQGSDLYPDDGATVVVRAPLNVGSKLRLTGPGIEFHHDIKIAGLPTGFWHMRQELIRYPMGFDLFFVDGDQVLGIPRSTKVEEL